MRLDAEEVSAAIDVAISSRLRAAPPESHEDEIERSNLVNRAEQDGFDEVWEALIDEHGPEAVLASLAPHKADPLIAAVLTYTCEIFNHPLREYFTADEIVSAAASHILAVPRWKSGIRDGGWLFSALYSHLYGLGGVFDDEEHFELVIALLDRIPVDNDFALFVIGDGPLAHASEKYHERIQELAETHPSVKEAWFQNLTDGVREFDAAAQEANKGRSGDPVAVCVELSPDVTYGVVLTRLASRDDYLLDDLLRRRSWCEWEQITTGSGGGVQWSLVDENRGILRFSGAAPAGASTAIVEYRGHLHPVPVKKGYFLFVDWNSESPSDARVERFDRSPTA